MNRLALACIIGVLLTYACSPQTEQQESTTALPDRQLPGIHEIGVVENTSNHLPHLFSDTTGQLYISFVESIEDSSILKYSKLNARLEWDKPITVANGNNWFVNWADYPMVSTFAGKNMLGHYLAMNGDGTFHYEVTMTTSQDSGESWNDPFVIHDDGKQAEHGFVSMVPYGNDFFVSWLDGRNAGSEGGHHTGAMNLRAAVVSPSGDKLEEWLLDDRVCDCCQTAAAITNNGPVVVYRDRSKSEVRDMYIMRYVDGDWSEPKAIHDDNWEIHGCPVNGPRVSVDGNDVAIAWYTGAPESRVNVVFSEDVGETFSEPVRLDEGSPIGRVDVELIEDGAMVSWMEGSNLMAARTNREQVLERYLIANSTNSRSSGFPQMQAVGDTLIFAWTDTEAGHIKTGWMGL